MASITAATERVDAALGLPPARFALLVRSTDDRKAKAREIEAALAPLGADVRQMSPLETSVLVLTLPGRVFGVDDAAAFEAAEALRAEFSLDNAEPDLPTNFFPVPSGQRATKDPAEEGLDDLLGCWTPEQPGLEIAWALKSMRVAEAWQFSIDEGRPDRGAGVVIAQPDTGVTTHDELLNVVQVNPRDVLDEDGDPTDPLEDVGNPGHGTGTASVVVSPETHDMAGSAPKARHMPIRAIRSVVRITQVSVAEAIEWAVDHGAHVITMSLGGIPAFSLHRALRRAVAADVIVLAAAGNCVRTVVWPARYDDCIAVAGTNVEDAQWPGTCRGSAVDFSAPAENVFRARIVSDGGPPIGQGQGTSFAVALTAGVAALWLAHHGRPNLIGAARTRGETLQAMFRRLVRATARRPAGWDSFNMGAGIVDARALLAADLDAGRELESAPQADSAAVRSEISMQSFVLETSGVDMRASDLDWNRHGPELVNALLRSRVREGRAPGHVSPEFRPLTPALSAPLADALGESLKNELFKGGAS
jgi:hypothetical protein